MRNGNLFGTRSAALSVTFLTFLLLVAAVPPSFAAQTTPADARKAVLGWLQRDPAPMGVALGRVIGQIDAYPDAQGLRCTTSCTWNHLDS